ncbi:MAG TPA: hypothetical protein VF773_06290 [Verrucomicrobiae bacterium]
MNDATPPPIPPQNPAATPPPASEKKFTLSKPVFFVWLILLGITIYLGVTRNLDARGLGQGIGQFVGITLMSLLFSWIAWRLARRSDWVKSAVFLIVFLVAGSDHLAGLHTRGARPGSPSLENFRDEVRRVHEAQQEEFNETGVISHNTEALDKLITTMKDGASQGTDLQRKMMSGLAEYMEHLNKAQARHAEAVERMDSAWILQPTTSKTVPEIETLAAAVTNFVHENRQFTILFTNSTAFLTKTFKEKGVPPDQISSALAGFNKGFKPQLPLVKTIREQDNIFGAALLEILNLYKAHHGKWKWDEQSETVTFENEPTSEQWLELVTTISETAEEQQQTQAKLIELRSKTMARQAN